MAKQWAKPLVVKLSEEDNARLQYVMEQTGLDASTTLIRLLIRAASEGEVKSGPVHFEFTPYSEAKKSG